MNLAPRAPRRARLRLPPVIAHSANGGKETIRAAKTRRWFQWRRVSACFGWGSVSVVATLALLWTIHADSLWWVIYAAAGAPWLCLATCIAALGAMLVRMRALACAFGFLALVGVAWLAPELLPVSTAAVPPSAAAPLRIFDANVEYSNVALGGIAEEIRHAHPDVVTLEELTNAGVAALGSTGVLGTYRWHFVAPDSGSNGIGVWSDVPLTDVRLWFAAAHPEVMGVLSMPDGARLQLLVVHTTAPRNGSTTQWRRELSAVAAAVRQTSQPMIVAGDFNATSNMYEFQRILHAGLSDTAVKQGKGWEMTWSRQLHVVPPLVRIDHVLYSKGITSTSYRTGGGSGSDHRPIVAELAVGQPGS